MVEKACLPFATKNNTCSSCVKNSDTWLGATACAPHDGAPDRHPQPARRRNDITGYSCRSGNLKNFKDLWNPSSPLGHDLEWWIWSLWRIVADWKVNLTSTLWLRFGGHGHSG